MADAPSLREVPLLLEAFFFVRGVGLAFLADKWRDRRNRLRLTP